MRRPTSSRVRVLLVVGGGRPRPRDGRPRASARALGDAGRRARVGRRHRRADGGGGAGRPGRRAAARSASSPRRCGPWRSPTTPPTSWWSPPTCSPARRSWPAAPTPSWRCPGGFGTLEELLEQLTGRLLGFHDKPIVLVDVGGFWQPLLELFEHLYRERFARPESRGRLRGRRRTSAGVLAALDAPRRPRCRASGSERRLRRAKRWRRSARR